MDLPVSGFEERAVTPVIGVVLMVGVTIILATTVHVFMLGYTEGSLTDPPPQADFTLTVEQCGGDRVVVTHHSGQTIVGEQLVLRSQELSLTGSWADPDGYDTTGVVAGVVGAGDQANVCVDNHDEVTIQVIWKADNGNREAILAEWTLDL